MKNRIGPILVGLLATIQSSRSFMFLLKKVEKNNPSLLVSSRRRHSTVLPPHRLRPSAIPTVNNISLKIAPLITENGQIKIFRSIKNHLSTTALSAEKKKIKKAANKFKNFEEMLDKYVNEKPVFVSFHAPLCGPCHLLKKELESVREIMADRGGLKIFIVDTEKWPHLASQYHIQSLPTSILFWNREVVHRIEGLHKACDIVSEIEKSFGKIPHVINDETAQ